MGERSTVVFRGGEVSYLQLALKYFRGKKRVITMILYNHKILFLITIRWYIESTWHMVDSHYKLVVFPKKEGENVKSVSTNSVQNKDIT